MKVVVLGAGLMGKEAARDLLKSGRVQKVYLADADVKRAESFSKEMLSDKLAIVLLDAEKENQLRDVMALGDIVINALFYSFNEKVAQTAIEIGVHAVDLGGHIGGVTDKILQLDSQAKQKGVTLIPDLGVAPGMINILAGYGAGKLDTVRSIRLFVGGVPVHPKPPLNYHVVFSLEGLFDHYSMPSLVLRDGVKKEIPSLSEIEKIDFDGYGEMEAFHTSGGTSTLPQSFPNVETLEYKTIRYKGHAQAFQLLVDLGFLSPASEVVMDGRPVNVRSVIREHLGKQLQLGDEADAVLLRVITEGEKDGQPLSYTYNMTTEKDPAANITAMARATANTISIAAQMIGAGIIKERGVLPPEKSVPGKLYIEEMKKRGVIIQETLGK